MLLSVISWIWISYQFLSDNSWVSLFVFLYSQIFQFSLFDLIWILMLRLLWHFDFVLPLTHFRIGSCIRLLLLPVVMNCLFYISPTWSPSAEGTGWRDTSHRLTLGSCKWPEPNCDGPAVTWLQESDTNVKRRQLECAHLTESPLKPLHPILTTGSGEVPSHKWSLDVPLATHVMETHQDGMYF